MAQASRAAAGAGGAAARSKASRRGLRGARRRLSVVSDNKLVEGVAHLGDVGDREVRSKRTEHVINMYAGVCKKGYAPYNPRKKNQDAILMDEHADTGSIFFAVFDGHGEAGDLVSHFFTDRLASRVFANSRFRTDPNRAVADETARLERALLAGVCERTIPSPLGVARDFLAASNRCSNAGAATMFLHASIDTDFSGTTAVEAIVRDNKVYVNNIGDSRIILGRAKSNGEFEAVPVSDDHKPDRPDEQARIEERGGRVFAIEYDDGIDGPARVWLGNMDIPGLAMARSLGDVVAHSAGVISDPEYHIADITPADKIMVLASDGLWEFISNQEVIDMIVSTGMKDPRRAIDMLVEESNARWMREEQVIDDTTIIVAFLN